MTYYTAKMRHSPETVRKFVRLQYDTFEWWRKPLMLLLSGGCVILGLSSGSALMTVFCFFVGAMLLTNTNTRADSVADRVTEAMGGNYPPIAYTFDEDSFSDGPDRPEIPYGNLIRLVRDDRFCYLFFSKASGYMMERESIEGEDAAEGFMRFLTAKTGLNWTAPFSLLTFRLRDLAAFRGRPRR